MDVKVITLHYFTLSVKKLFGHPVCTLTRKIKFIFIPTARLQYVPVSP